jgi:hypothetical protein
MRTSHTALVIAATTITHAALAGQVWFVAPIDALTNPDSSCVVSDFSPAQKYESSLRDDAKLVDYGNRVDVEETNILTGHRFTTSFFRTIASCNEAIAAQRDAERRRHDSLNKYR